MLAKTYSVFLYALEGRIVEVEVEVEPGLRSFTIVGLPDEAVKEAVKRVSLALRNSGFLSPSQLNKKVTVNLAPADIKKQGSYFDLAIAIAFLVSSSQLSPVSHQDLFWGELSFQGALRQVRGALVLAIVSIERGFGRVFFPYQNALEVSLVKRGTFFPARSLGEVVLMLQSPAPKPTPFPSPHVKRRISPEPEYDFSEIRGQEFAKRALEIAAAGRHHLFLVGPPGAGKSILAKAFIGLLPSLDQSQALELGKILSMAGLLDGSPPLIERQFRAPHHSASATAILGGGNPLHAGEITLAHHGVLFLDEFPEFHRDVLESLRQPLETKTIHVARSQGSFQFPADFQLIGAANPCPCGFREDRIFPCVCAPGELSRYARKLSGPLIDRIDLWVPVPRLSKEELLVSEQSAESSSDVKKRVMQALAIQKDRFKKARTNSSMTLREIKTFCILGGDSEELLGQAIEKLGLSARGYHRVLKVSRTIADLEQSQNIKLHHVSEALQYRRLTQL